MKKSLILLLLLITTMSFSSSSLEPRSPEWEKARALWLKTHPVCAICGSTKLVQVHHVMVFHRHPEKELDQTNYVTVCTSKSWGYNDHLLLHGGNFQLENPWSKEDAERLHVILDPKYIKAHTSREADDYIKMMFARIKKYNCDTYQFRCSKK